MNLLQKRVAEGAVGATALRNQGAKGVIAAAREFLKNLDLSRFLVESEDRFMDVLDSSTRSMQKYLPPDARHWGAARKGLNLFLRDVLYNRYLSERFGFKRIEKWMEVPLDRFAAQGIMRDYSVASLPAWPGLKHLTPEISKAYQKAALALAASRHLSRVHLDILYWRGLGHLIDNTIKETYMQETYATCVWCDKPISYGNTAVTINRNIEQMDRTDEHPDGVVTVIQSDVVTTLCGNCGNRLDIDALRKIVSTPIRK